MVLRWLLKNLDRVALLSCQVASAAKPIHQLHPFRYKSKASKGSCRRHAQRGLSGGTEPFVQQAFPRLLMQLITEQRISRACGRWPIVTAHAEHFCGISSCNECTKCAVALVILRSMCSALTFNRFNVHSSIRSVCQPMLNGCTNVHSPMVSHVGLIYLEGQAGVAELGRSSVGTQAG